MRNRWSGWSNCEWELKCNHKVIVLAGLANKLAKKSKTKTFVKNGNTAEIEP